MTFDATGHEQSGRRPVLVLSPALYNERTGLAIVCPLTTKVKGYPFEVVTELNGKRSAILADHVKSLDWQARKAKYIAAVPSATADRTAALVSALIGGSHKRASAR